MAESLNPLEADWLTLCRRVVSEMREMFAQYDTVAARAVEVGQGEGGDRTLVIDQAAEEIVFDQLELLSREGYQFSVVSEERGSVSYGGSETLVVVDPIDGSLNAKRGLPSCSLSIAVASGTTMADVEFGYVYDFGTAEEWHASRGGGAWLGERRLESIPPARWREDGKLEVIGIESADPRWVGNSITGLEGAVYRLRAIGSIAISLCQVAAGRLDGMLSLRPCRSVDAAAAKLVVSEAGGRVAFPGCAETLGVPLDLVPHSAVVAAADEEALRQLLQVTRDP